MSPEVGDNREILAYFCFMLHALSFQLVAPRVTCLRYRVVAYRDAITMQRADAAK